MDISERTKLLEYVAPCSLLCYSCPAYKEGVICDSAQKLCNYFIGYYNFMMDNLPKEYLYAAEEFKTFRHNLESYTRPKCNGCRNSPAQECCITGCIIPDCVKGHGVNFCGECEEFPCSKVNTDIYTQKVIELWLKGSNRIKEIGISRYFEEMKSLSHYIAFKKD